MTIIRADESAFYQRVGHVLRQMRIDKGLSQMDASEASMVSFQQIQKYESGRNRVPLLQAMLLAEAFGTTVPTILDRARKAAGGVQ